MSVRKRGDSYQVTVCWNGQIHRRSSRHWDRAKAREVETKLLNDLHAQEMGRKPDRTFNEAIEKWMKEDLHRLKSEKSYLSYLKCIAPILEGRSLKDVDEVVSEIRAMKPIRGEQPIKASTINRRLATVRRLLSLAYSRWGWLDQPLHMKVALLREAGGREVFLTTQQVNRIAALCPRAGDAFMLAAYTGIRKSQLLRLTSAHKVANCLHLGTDSKSGKPQVIPLHKRVQDIKLPLRVTATICRYEFEEAREKVGLPHVRWHDARHTFASWLIQADQELTHIKELLGHSSVSVTQKYTHLRSNHLRKAINKIR